MEEQPVSEPVSAARKAAAVIIIFGVSAALFIVYARRGLGSLLLAMGGVLLAALVIFVVRRRRFARANQRALALLDAGDAPGAAEMLEALGARAVDPDERALARYNAGVAHLVAGAWERSVEVLGQAARDEAFAAGKTALAQLAVTHALAGQLDEATAWLARAATQLAPDDYPLVWARTAVAARRGDPAELGWLWRKWPELAAFAAANQLT